MSQWLERTSSGKAEQFSDASMHVGYFRLHPPQQLVQLVHRPALLGGLDQALQRRLVLLQAPAGYGKTTLLSQWWDSLARRGIRAAWLTLDEDSRIAAEFLAHVIQALAMTGIDVGELGAATLQSPEGASPRIALNALIYELDRIEDQVILILDDYHLAQSPETDELLDLLIRRMPENFHVVLATRLRPGLALPSLRAQGQVQEFAAEQLRFSLNEAFDLLRPAVSDDEIASLAERSEGWPIALQLAALWVRDHQTVEGLLQSFSGSADDMADYLATQVFAALPEHLQTFLLETSIFDQFNSEAADAARDTTDSGLLMEELKRLNVLLIPVDRERAWFRHHHLVSEFLASRRSRLGDPRLRELQARASLWFEARGQLLEAVRHASAGGDRARAVGLIEQAGCVRLCLEEGVPRAKSLFALLRPSEIDASARLRLASALVLFKEGRLQAGDRALDDARRIAETSMAEQDNEPFRRDLLIILTLRAAYRDTELSAAEYEAMDSLSASNRETDPWLSGLLNNLLCLLHLRRGDIDSAKLCVHKALGFYRESENLYGAVFMNIHLGTISLVQGHLVEAENALHVAEEMTFDHFGGNTSMLAIAQILLAEIAYERNNVTRATELLEENLAIIATSEGWAEIYASGYAAAAQLCLANRDLAGAEAALDRGDELLVAHDVSRVRVFLQARRATILVRAGQVEEARAALHRACSFEGVKISWSETDEIALARARLRLADSDPGAALEALAPVLRAAENQKRLRSVLNAEALRALALKALDRPDEAALALLGMLERARGEGYRRLFIDEGPAMADLLTDAVRRRGPANLSAATLDYVADLLAGFGELTRSDEKARLLKALTPREREILQELSRGVANKVIARALDLNENAVKFHLKNIYRKLGVASRAMAVTVAQKLELLS